MSHVHPYNHELFCNAQAGLCAMTQESMDVQEVSQKHWLSALQTMKPSLSEEQVERYQQMSAASDWPR